MEMRGGGVEGGNRRKGEGKEEDMDARRKEDRNKRREKRESEMG